MIFRPIVSGLIAGIVVLLLWSVLSAPLGVSIGVSIGVFAGTVLNEKRRRSSIGWGQAFAQGAVAGTTAGLMVAWLQH
jgi:hypothetical protein